MGCVHSEGVWLIVGHTHGVIAVEQTSMPARKNALITRMFSGACAAVVYDRVRTQ
jgi:hypothetical protein